MRRYFKKTIAVLAASLMCSAFIGGGVLAENESGSDQSEGVCPVSVRMYSTPGGGTQSSPRNLEVGETIEYYAKVTNENDDADYISDVEVRFHIDDSLTTELSTAMYNLTEIPSSANKKPISDSPDYSAEFVDGNDVIFRADKLDWDSSVMFHITCTAGEQEGVVSSKASIVSVGKTSYTGVETAPVWHELSYGTSRFSVSTVFSSANKVQKDDPAIMNSLLPSAPWGGFVDGNHEYGEAFDGQIITYNLNLKRGTAPLNCTLQYKQKAVEGNDVVEKLSDLKVENGKAAIKGSFTIEAMPAGVTYDITVNDSTNSFTLDNTRLTGTTEKTDTNEIVRAEYKYIPVDYSPETSIVTKMEGRSFKDGDVFSYRISSEDEFAPQYCRFPLESVRGEDRFYEDFAEMAPKSGSSAALSLGEKREGHSAIFTSCGNYYMTQPEDLFYTSQRACFCNYSVGYANMNVNPELHFLYPGTYSYVVSQSTFETDDQNNIMPDRTQYKLNIQVIASGSKLTASIESVQKSTDNGATWQAQTDKSQLVFTNKFETNPVIKGDVDGNRKVEMQDVMLCLNHVSKKRTLKGNALIAADVDGNGVAMSDVMKILNYVSKKSSAL